MSTIRPHLIAYARISDLSGKRGTLAGTLGVDAQHSACESMARDAGATVIKQYTDNDRSAGQGDRRAGFEAMLADLYAGHTAEHDPVHGVITVDVDRIYKTPDQWERFVAAFRAAPKRMFMDWQGRRDLYATDAEEAGLHDVSAMMGENLRRSDRTKRWHAAQARRGIAHTGGRTFGYRAVLGVPGAIEVVPEEAAIIREAVAACADGRPWGMITWRLTPPCRSDPSDSPRGPGLLNSTPSMQDGTNCARITNGEASHRRCSSNDSWSSTESFATCFWRSRLGKQSRRVSRTAP